MARRPVVLGWPISMALRGLKGISGVSKTGALGAVVGIGAGLGAITAAGALVATNPWVQDKSESSASEAIPLPAGAGLASLSGLSGMTDFIGGVLTFMDMNAQVVQIKERRRMAVISIPGRESDFLQDLGGHTVRYSVSGKFFDQDPKYMTHRGIMQTILKSVIDSAAVGSTQMLRLIMRTASPVPFITEHELSFAVITEFGFTQVGGEPEWVNYDMTLLEFQRIPYLAKMALLATSNWVANVAEGT